MLKGSCKKIFAGIAIISLAGSIFPVMPIVSAENLPSYYERSPSEREKALLLARDFAYQYLKNSSEEPLWKNKYPYISGEKFFYTANDDIPSYVEFKVSTGENADSGFIIVNLDNNDVKVPIASPSGKTPSEALNIRFDKNHGKNEKEKLYYFSPFDQWIVDENGNAETLNPNNQEDEVVENNSEISLRSAENFSKNNQEKILTEEGKNKQNTKFAEMKKDAVEFVNSPEMRSVRIERNIATRGYIDPGSSDKLLPFRTNNTNCLSPLPCYDQFSFPSWWWSCESGCTPTALAMILIYHDQGKFSNIFPGTAPVTNDSNRNSEINKFITELRDVLGTNCGGGTGFLNLKNVEGYLKKKGYNSTVRVFETPGREYDTTQVARIAKNEINAGRPMIISTNGHSIGVWGYKTSNNYILRLNMGWGQGWYGVDGYSVHSVDMDIRSMWHNGSSRFLDGYFTLNIR